ncbi:LysR family transcriptional regulator [Methylobacterium oxalidis]|uniref:LysR family transcriptional regulator n=1 Tax=Methylobacterium oxalidis TaxID=944322 RepID=UPI0033161FC3
MIDKLDYLLALSREQHFGRAAEACSVSQQALSAGIKYLENRLGVQLVQRDSRFQGFTPEGERVLAWARRIIADSRAMQQDVRTLRRGLSGHLRIAVIPTALPMVAALTTPYRERHPDVRLTIESTTSSDIFSHLKNLEADAGITYLDNEPLGHVTAIPMYREHYRLVTAVGGPFYDRDVVTWADVARTPLCLLTPNMQNRRIVDEQIRKAGVEPTPALESNSMIVLLTHVHTLRWASVMPAILVDALGSRDDIRAIPIMDPNIQHTIGLVALDRDPSTPTVNALMSIARDVARSVRGNGVAVPGLPNLRASLEVPLN